MSNRERCNAILDSFSDAQLSNAAAVLQALKQAIDDTADEAFCEKMVQDYNNDPEQGDPMPIEDFAKQLGIVL